ncbi:MAG: hypothetical protein ACR2O1_14790 [Boseongicola sp.]
MNSTNYNRSIRVSAEATAAFDAVTKGIEHWWTRPDNPLTKVGDRAKFTFPPGRSYWTFELTKADPSGHVEWECVDALHIHEGQPKEIETEWLGTKVLWSIKQDGSHTDIEIEHAGLQPELHCYDVCKAGWDIFVLDSLRNYLETGEGSPHQAPVG